MKKTTVSYFGITLVIIIWGISPIISLDLLQYFSPCIKVAVSQLCLCVFFYICCRKKLRQTNLKNYTFPIISGIFYSAALLLQNIGLPYTTPAKFSFFENLDCVIVPVATFILTGKIPKKITVAAACVCVFGIYLLNTKPENLINFNLGMGELLCAISGICYGINFTITGLYVNKTGAGVFLFLQRFISVFVSFFVAVCLNFIKFKGNIIEKAFAPDNIFIYLYLAVFTLLVSGVGWLIRTNCMKYLANEQIAVIMPLASVITGIVSVIIGTDIISFGLILGGTLIICAIFLSSISSLHYKKIFLK